MDLNPRKIYEDFKKKVIDELSAVDSLIYLIENADMVGTRLECIRALQRIKSKKDEIFSILENLLISDSSEEIRILAANALKVIFQEKALSPLKWALDHEKSWQFLLDIISNISKFNNDGAKSALINKIKRFENYQFNKSLSPFFKTKEIQDFNLNQLADIVNSYVVIKYIKNILKEINFKVESGLVTELNLSFTSEKTSGWKVLKNLSEFIRVFNHLKKLELKSNQIGRFPKSILSLDSLKYLDLSHNNMNKIPDGIRSLTSLEYFNLRYNHLEEIPNSIGLLSNLKTLDLKHNKLSTLPATMGELASLEVLNLHGNQFKILPPELEKLTSLKKLKLGLNNLNSVPAWLTNLHYLKKLGLGMNKELSNFQEWIDHLPPVVELNLYGNDIKVLPESIGTLNTLEVLILPNNKLIELPESFRKLTSLKKLDLSWNDITKLPEWISSLFSLEELNLRGNKLETLPESISSLKFLNVLNVTLNKNIIDIPNSLQNKGLQIYR